MICLDSGALTYDRTVGTTSTARRGRTSTSKSRSFVPGSAQRFGERRRALASASCANCSTAWKTPRPARFAGSGVVGGRFPDAECGPGLLSAEEFGDIYRARTPDTRGCRGLMGAECRKRILRRHVVTPASHSSAWRRPTSRDRGQRPSTVDDRETVLSKLPASVDAEAARGRFLIPVLGRPTLPIFGPGHVEELGNRERLELHSPWRPWLRPRRSNTGVPRRPSGARLATPAKGGSIPFLASLRQSAIPPRDVAVRRDRGVHGAPQSDDARRCDEFSTA